MRITKCAAKRDLRRVTATEVELGYSELCPPRSLTELRKVLRRPLHGGAEQERSRRSWHVGIGARCSTASASPLTVLTVVSRDFIVARRGELSSKNKAQRLACLVFSSPTNVDTATHASIVH